MIGRIGYGAADPATLCDRYQRKLDREVAKKNPRPDAMLRFKRERDYNCRLSQQADMAAMQTFAERTGLDQALSVNTPPPVVVRQEVQSTTWWYPVAAGGIVLLIALGAAALE